MLNYIKNFFNTNISFLILLIIVVLSLYGKSICFELTGLDDDILITKNINFISDYKNIPKLFTTSAFYNNTTLYYRPVLSLSFALESFFVRDNLKFYHITNIILFILSLYLLYLFCMELKLNSVITKFVLLIMAVHPMFSSVIVWLPGRNDSLLTVFFVLSFIFFIKYINTQKIKFAVLFCLFFIVSLFTKETFIMLIPLYFIGLYFCECKIAGKKLITLCTVLIPFVVLFFILRKCSVASFSLEYYISNAGILFKTFIKDSFIYFYNFFVPENIPTILFNAKLNLSIIVCNCFLIGVLFFVIYKRILPYKIIIFSILFVFLSIFPTFLQKEDVYLNHRFFICSVGFIIFIVSLFNYLVSKFNKLKSVFIMLFCVCFVCLCILSYKQADKYKNYETFWINAYNDSPQYHVTNQHLSHVYINRNDMEKAKYYAEKAVNLKSSFATVIDYAAVLMIIGDLDRAEFAFLEIEKDIKGSKNLLYYPLSEIYYKKQDYKKALEYALKAYDIKPYDIDYCKQLIKIYHVSGNYIDELKIYEKLSGFDKNNKEYKNKINELKEKINSKETQNA